MSQVSLCFKCVTMRKNQPNLKYIYNLYNKYIKPINNFSVWFAAFIRHSDQIRSDYNQPLKPPPIFVTKTIFPFIAATAAPHVIESHDRPSVSHLFFNLLMLPTFIHRFLAVTPGSNFVAVQTLKDHKAYATYKRIKPSDLFETVPSE